MNTEGLARALGWFSIGLGLTEVAAAGKLGRSLGMEDRTGLLRVFGLREIATGVGILSQPKPAPWLWARVAGDLLDLAVLGSAFTADNPKRNRVGVATGVVAAVTVADALCGLQLQEVRRPRQWREPEA